MRDFLSTYSQYYDSNQLSKKLRKLTGKVSEKLLYSVLILYYLLANKKIPFRTRAVIVAALGYFILPADMVSDFIPIMGFTDDLAMLSFAMTGVIEYITPELKSKANEKLEKLLNRKVKKELDEHPSD